MRYISNQTLCLFQARTNIAYRDTQKDRKERQKKKEKQYQTIYRYHTQIVSTEVKMSDYVIATINSLLVYYKQAWSIHIRI